MQIEFLKIVLTVLGMLSAPLSLIFYLARDRYTKLEKLVDTHETRQDKMDIRFEEVIKDGLESNHKMELEITTLKSEKISQDQLDKAIQSVEKSVKTEISSVKEELKEAKKDALRREDNQAEFQRLLMAKLDRLAEK
jgi:uncharacterized protein (DUF305 family)